MLLSAGKISTLCKEYSLVAILMYWCFDCLNRIKGIEKDILLIITLAGFIILDGVYTSAVTNYAIQSELNISLLYSIGMKVKNKGYDDIDAAIRVCTSTVRPI